MNNSNNPSPEEMADFVNKATMSGQKIHVACAMDPNDPTKLLVDLSTDGTLERPFEGGIKVVKGKINPELLNANGELNMDKVSQFILNRGLDAARDIMKALGDLDHPLASNLPESSSENYQKP